MVTSLLLENFNGVKRLEISKLSKTNVICGKNSSGKSSILNCIASPDNISIACDVDVNNIIDRLYYAANASESPSIKRLLSDAVEDCQKQIPVWYPESQNSIAVTLYNHFTIGVLRQFKFKDVVDVVISKYFNELTNRFKPIVIPPKRQIVNNIFVNHSETFQPNGDGLINHLFFLKNQDIKSGRFIEYNRIYDAFKKITGHQFNVVLNKNNTLTLSFYNGIKWMSADYCGLGLSDVLIILAVIISSNSEFILIEEPETHLHADFQRKLLTFIGGVDYVQFLIATHSNIFVDANRVDKIYYSWFDKEVKITDQTTPSKILSSLGHSVVENLTSDAIILTEGPKDIPVIRQLLKWVGVYDKYNVKIWPLGGDIMGELDLTFFSDRSNVFAIIDNDPGSSAARRKFYKNCKEHNIGCYTLKRYAIENYFTAQALRKVFRDQIAETLVLTHDRSVDEQIGFKAKDKSIKAKNFEIIEHMSVSDFEQTDILEFIVDIKSKLDKQFSTKEDETPVS